MRLTRTWRQTTVLVIAAGVLLAAFPAAARAGGGGSGFTLTQCGQVPAPGCTVTAGDPPGSGTPGSSGTGPGTGTLTGHSGGGCPGTVSQQFGCVPPGCKISNGTLGCPLGAAGPGGRAAGPPAPGVLAELAVRLLRLPGPVIRSSPATAVMQLAELPTWLWMAPGVWGPRSATASVPSQSVTATAAPVAAAWQMGDGHTVTCQGPGTPYTGSSPASASPDCGHTYTRSSAGQPGAAFRVRVTITWDITWRGGGTAGTLPPLVTVAAALFRVAESQAVNP